MLLGELLAVQNPPRRCKFSFTYTLSAPPTCRAMEARPAGTANLARTGRTSEGRCGGAIARIEMYMYSAIDTREE